MAYRYGVLIVPVAEVNQSVANSATCTGKKTDVIQNSSIGDSRQQMLLHRRVLIISNCRKGAHTHEGRQLVYSRCLSENVDDFHCRLKKSGSEAWLSEARIVKSNRTSLPREYQKFFIWFIILMIGIETIRDLHVSELNSFRSISTKIKKKKKNMWNETKFLAPVKCCVHCSAQL